MSIPEKLEKYAANNLNVLLIGPHGIGKSTIVKGVAEKLDLRMSYYSASTLDPWTDVVGVPKPVDGEDGEEYLKFYRPKQLLEAEFLFFDELNRAHPKVLNAVLEIIQFKTVNGRALPNLRMVWAAINPPGEDYDVEDLDPALLDRFHIQLTLKAEFNMKYMKTKMDEGTARALHDWWETDLNKDQRRLVTPRRLEYLGFLIDRDLEWKDALPAGMLPYDHLSKRLLALKHGIDLDVQITKEALLSTPKVFAQRGQKNPSDWIKIRDIVSKLDPSELFLVRDVLESMPKDIVYGFASKKFPRTKQDLYDKFIKNGVTPQTYPKVYQCFDFNRFDVNG